ncbi:Mbov_0399 family ICE element protein [Mycoplasmopsis primatum]|uniref:Mbov_0399 family ICE element protein n=1 Tax=Mycoplasmopsis primatum TaxID=55604 RepID=UPI000494F8E4|nr:hypothetical protein [Mycoplasmopsis primatum]
MKAYFTFGIYKKFFEKDDKTQSFKLVYNKKNYINLLPKNMVQTKDYTIFKWTDNSAWINWNKHIHWLIPNLNLKTRAELKEANSRVQTINMHFIDYKYNLASRDLRTISLELQYDYWNGNVEEQKTFWNELQVDFNDNLLKNKKIYSLTDVGGDLYTPFNEKILNVHSNSYYLEQKLNEYFQKLYVSKKEKFDKLKGISLESDWLNTFKDLGLGYSVANSNMIDIYFLNRVLIRGVKIEFVPTDHYKNARIFDRLKFEFGKWVDFQKGTTELVDDVPERDETDKKEIGLQNGVYYDGRWIVHTPMKVSFDSFSENEVLIINGKRIDVLNGHFEEDLNDLRIDANDNERILNENIVDENTEKNDENSHKKNEFKIQILKYRAGSKGNLDTDLELTYEKTFIIDSKSSMEDFKWYAWDPENNKHQRELIEEYLKNEKGELLKNEKGDYIKNPKYDPLIDAKTGTKKQLVLMDFSKIGFTFENNFNHNTPDYNYACDSKLPYKSKFLFPPHSTLSNFQKVIAEAVVIEKGGIKELIGDTQNFTLFKLNEETFTFEKVEGDKYFKELETTTSESSYFSNEGTWLFCSNAKNSISNFKLVMIRGDKSNNNYFTELQKYNRGEIVPLWKSDLGDKIRAFILKDGTFKKENIYKLSYEDVLEWYKKYINYLYKNSSFTHYIKPVFKAIENNKYSYNQFLELYAIQGLKRANNGESLSEGDRQFNENKINDPENRKKFMKFKDDFLGDFDYKDRVEIDYVEMSPNKDGVYVKLKLNTLDRSFAFEANSGYQLIKIKFSDINTPNDKQALELKVNSDWFINFAKTKTQSQFENEIWLHKKLWFTNLNEIELEMLNLSVVFNASTGLLTLNASLKDSFKKEYYLPYSSFEIAIKEFNTDPVVNSGIFEGYNFDEFNLNGLDTKKEIEAYILKIIDENFKGLVRNKDFAIKNLDAVIDEMKMVQIGTNKKLMKFTNLTLEAIGDKIGFKNIRVYNYVRKYIANDINLNNLKISDVEIDANSYKDIMNKIIKHVNDALKEHNLIYGYEIDIQNFVEGINKLMLGNGADFVFKVVGIHKKVKGSISFKVVNSAKEVLDSNGNKYLYDLSSIRINDLSYKEYRMNILKEKILADVFKVMKGKYQLEFKKHYDIDINALNLLIMAITKKSEKEIVGVLKLKSVNGVSKNETDIRIHNHNKDYDAINDLDSSIPDAESLKKKAKQKKTILLSTLIPLGLFGLIGLGTLAWFVYVRKYSKRVK